MNDQPDHAGLKRQTTGVETKDEEANSRLKVEKHKTAKLAK